MRVALGAFQFLDIERTDLGEQFTESGDEPNTLICTVTSPFDEHFKNTTVTLLLSEKAQRTIIETLQHNLNQGGLK